MKFMVVDDSKRAEHRRGKPRSGAWDRAASKVAAGRTVMVEGVAAGSVYHTLHTRGLTEVHTRTVGPKIVIVWCGA